MLFIHPTFLLLLCRSSNIPTLFSTLKHVLWISAFSRVYLGMKLTKDLIRSKRLKINSRRVIFLISLTIRNQLSAYSSKWQLTVVSPAVRLLFYLLLQISSSTRSYYGNDVYKTNTSTIITTNSTNATSNTYEIYIFYLSNKIHTRVHSWF